MMLLERWAVAVLVGVGLASTIAAHSQDPQQTQQNQDKSKQDTEDAEPAEFHPPAELGPPSILSPPLDSHPAPEPKPQMESRPPAPSTAQAPAPPPEPSLSSDPVERQLQIDTAHLLQLTEQLKAELDKAGTNTLSLAALRKAEEVQRLARTLKERMKDRGQVVPSKP